jgi:hypothetical protein
MRLIRREVLDPPPAHWTPELTRRQICWIVVADREKGGRSPARRHDERTYPASLTFPVLEPLCSATQWDPQLLQGSGRFCCETKDDAG